MSIKRDKFAEMLQILCASLDIKKMKKKNTTHFGNCGVWCGRFGALLYNNLHIV